MEIKLELVLAVVLAALCLGTSALSLPEEVKENELEAEAGESNELDGGRRATWLDTRQLKDEFKELVLVAMEELVDEGRLTKEVMASGRKENDVKRGGRWQGFCFRRTRSGRFLPYICWKGGNKDKGRK